MDFPLGVLHDVHHALCHSPYEALGREESSNEGGKLPAGHSCTLLARNAAVGLWGSNLSICKKRLTMLRTFEPVIPLLGNHLKETGNTEKAF
jgi:hypothetical protein